MLNFTDPAPKILPNLQIYPKLLSFAIAYFRTLFKTLEIASQQLKKAYI